VSPDGTNINKGCGATATQTLQEQVVAHGAHLGIALDGDADRLIMVDEAGRPIDGDQLMSLIATSWARSQTLRGGGVVATVMSNLGMERHLGGLGLHLARTPVGDRYVVEMMRERGYNVGGEQSGHVVLSDYSTTGDGLIAALQVLAVLIQADGRSASEVCRVFDPVPQKLVNIRFAAGSKPLEDAAVQQAIKDGEARLASSGRVLIRKSGTEPLIRVMAEGDDEALVHGVVGDIADAIRASATRSLEAAQ
ncbi:MAG: phosphoglucosamine mutase, partial [Alphaproteobacteria bacterium]